MKIGKTYLAEVVERRKEKPRSDTTLLRLRINHGENFQARAGQFISLETTDGRYQMLRPFTIVDIRHNILSLLIKDRGENTKFYSSLRRGDTIKIIGPNGSRIRFHPKTDSYIFVGGGIGGAALAFPVKEARANRKKVMVILGGKTSSELVGTTFFKKIGIKARTITENSALNPGKVTDLLEEVLRNNKGRSKVIACGPKPMLKKVADLCFEYGNNGLVILEELMACGMGSCMGCSIFGTDGTSKRICLDGPAFDVRWIDWDKFMPAHQSVRVIDPAPKLSKIDMTRRLGNVLLEYPTTNSSGGLSLEALENGQFDYSKLGAITTKSFDLLGRPGNKQPRVCETPSGMINSIGIENAGLKKFRARYLPRWTALGKPLIVSISGSDAEEFATIAQELDGTDIFAIEENISCVNIKAGGVQFGSDPKVAFELTSKVREAAPSKFLIAKLTPNVTNIVEIAKAVRDAGADAVSLINTIRSMSIDTATRLPRIGNVIGGLSGPAIRPIAVCMVHQIFRANLGIPIIGMGGISDSDSAAEFMMAGADIVAAATSGFSDRQVFTNIANGLQMIIKRHGFTSARELTGSIILP